MAESIHVTMAPLTAFGVEEVSQRVLHVIECMDVRHMFFLRFGEVVGLEGWCPRVTIVPSLMGQHDYCAVFIDATVECPPPTQDSLLHLPMPQLRYGKWWEHWTSNTAFSRRDEAIHGSRFDDLVLLRFSNAMNRPERWRKVSLGALDQVNIYAEDELPEVEPDLIVGPRAGEE